MSPDTRQLDFEAALAEVIDRAARPADINRLVAAAIRLRAASLSLPADTPEPDVRTAEVAVLTAAADLAAGRASQNRVIEAHDELLLARLDVAPACDVEPWCTGQHGEFTPDVRGTITPRLHTRKWTDTHVSVGRLELAPGEPAEPGDEDTVIWLGDDELSIDEAGRLAADLAAAVAAVRGAGR